MIHIEDKSKCSGCYACVNACPQNCIDMLVDIEGFLYPKVNEKSCIACNKCENICPVLHKIKVENCPIVYAAYNMNEEVRENSSSGGIFTLIAEYVIYQKGVVFGACFDEKFNVVHEYVENLEELNKFRGSKYVQSKIGDTYIQAKEFLQSGRVVLFTGTPCQIAGLYAYLEKEYKNLITQDVICHGVPSPKVWRQYIKYIEKSNTSKVKKISQRNKKYGWKCFSTEILFENNTEYNEILERDLMMKSFLQNLCLRMSCYDCQFKTINRQSDITLGDFWGVENSVPELDDDKGISVIMINSSEGQAIFQSLQNSMIYKKVEIQEAVVGNSAIIQSVPYNFNRRAFLKSVDKLTFDVCVKKYCERTIFRKIINRIQRYVWNKRKRNIKQMMFRR